MRFEILYHGGTTHTVELSGSVAVLGRDPGCDVVLNDGKCSRRHATVEDLPEGLVVRDEGSANGTYVNGKRAEKARLRPGDTIRLGDTQLKLLADVGETVVMAPDDLLLRTSHEAPRPAVTARTPQAVREGALPPPEPAPPPAADPRRATAVPTGEVGRPATVTLLMALWVLFVPLSVATALLAAARFGNTTLAWGLGAGAGVALAGLGATMALGLRALAPWARHLQFAIAGIGLLLCPFTLASAMVLLYLSRPEVKAAFESRGRRPREGNGTEPTFALSLLAMLVLGLALTAIAVLFF